MSVPLIGMSRPSVTRFVRELQKAGLVQITRRGQGLTNLYTVKFVVRKRPSRKLSDVRRQTSRSQPAVLKRSTGRHAL
jgi:hypothetical protein